MTSDVVFLFTTSALGGPETFPRSGFSSRVVFLTAPGPAEGPERPKTATKTVVIFSRREDLGVADPRRGPGLV